MWVMFAHITFHCLLCSGLGVMFLESLNLHVHGFSPFCILLELLNVEGLDRQGMWRGWWEQKYRHPSLYAISLYAFSL